MRITGRAVFSFKPRFIRKIQHTHTKKKYFWHSWSRATTLQTDCLIFSSSWASCLYIQFYDSVHLQKK
ncbi:hypothetical protein BC940DRAFT_301714 [Gongronella butleri]|nr:hypothetical protein BC940DRAFT_301714 [Gongronella butleri]